LRNDFIVDWRDYSRSRWQLSEKLRAITSFRERDDAPDSNVRNSVCSYRFVAGNAFSAALHVCLRARLDVYDASSPLGTSAALFVDLGTVRFAKMCGQISPIGGSFHEVEDLLRELAAAKACYEKSIAKAELPASDWAEQEQRLSRLLQ
jgi:hypothetical protein